jgi:hypothetical protein
MSNKQKRLKGLVAGKAVLRAVCCAGACLGLSMAVAGVATNTQQSDPSAIAGKSSGKADSPFACSLEKSLTKEERAHKKQIAQKMESARIDTKEIAGGYVFRFRPEGVSFAEVADWVTTERVCCPFFDLGIEAERENGPVSLRITGREGVKNFIRAEFQTLKLR